MNIPTSFYQLRFKLLFTPLLALLLVFLISGGLITHLVNQALLHNEDARLALSSKILEELYTQWTTHARTIMKTIVVRPELTEAYFVAKTEDNLKLLHEEMSQGMQSWGASNALVLGKGGKVMLVMDKNSPDPIPFVETEYKNILNHPPISDAHAQLDEVVFFKIWQQNDKLYFLTIGPLLDVEDIVGSIIFVQEVKESFVHNIKKEMAERFLDGLSAIEVSLANHQHVIVTSLPSLSLPNPLQTGHHAFDSVVDSRPFRLRFMPLANTDIFLGLAFDISENEAARLAIRNTLIGIFSIAIILVFMIILFNANRIVASITTLVGYAKTIAGGDLTKKLTIIRHDEIGQLFHAITTMAGSLAGTIRTVALQSDTVEVCAKELTEVKKTLAGDSHDTHAIAKEVTEENDHLHHMIFSIQEDVSRADQNIAHISQEAQILAQNIQSVAKATGQASNHVRTVAVAAKEMTHRLQEANQHLAEVNTTTNHMAQSVQEMNASFQKVRERCDAGMKEANTTHQYASGSTDIMQKLNRSAVEIGKVVQLIQGIADQTRILSLNASIEAASAGDAGREFNVVAKAVKELARQTAEATRQIAQRIEDIQINTQEATQANQHIVNSIVRLHQAIEIIDQSVDQQSNLTQGIHNGIQGMANRITQLSKNAINLETKAHEVAQAADQAAIGTEQIAASSIEVATASRDMDQQSTDARNFVLAILDATRKTSESSIRVQDKILQAFRLAEFMQGSVSHFEKLTQVVEGTTLSLREAQAGLEVGSPPFDVQAEKQYHLNWLGRLEQLARGRIAAINLVVEKASHCPLGRWYEQAGKECFGEDPLFQELGRLHEQSHDLLHEAVLLAGQGSAEQMHTIIERIHAAREQLFDVLDYIYKSQHCQQALQTNPS